MIKTVVFDMYGVIIKESKGNFIPYVYKHFPNMDMGFLVKQFNKASIGKITSVEFLASLGFVGDLKGFEKDYLDNYITYDEEFSEVVQALKNKFRLAILSNDVSEWSKYLTEKHGIKEYFDISIISGNVDCRKPDCRIYEIMLEKISHPAEECLFIDNTVKNLIAAQGLGMDTVLFNRDNELFDGKIVNSFKELADLLAMY